MRGRRLASAGGRSYAFGMNRIDRIFAERRAAGLRTLMPFLTAGDPDLATTAGLLGAIEQAGGSICELGFPFSDPIADGPIIQASMAYALDHGVKISQIFDMVAQARASTELGLVAMVSYSIIHRLGEAAFVTRAKTAGFDGFIVPDLPVEEAAGFGGRARDAGLICSHLIAPTTSPERAELLARASSGFIYMVARSGITGVRSELPADLTDRVARLRQVTDLPIAVGFGVSSGEQVRQVVRVADAAIVGSAIVRRLEPYRGGSSQEAVAAVKAFVEELACGLTEPARQA